MFRSVAALGTTQLLAWACYYLPAVAAEPMAASLDLPATWIFAAFSGALLVAAALGPAAGRAIDRYGGRRVLALSNVLFAAGLCLMATAQGAVGMVAGWVVLGTAMSAGLYDAAFAALASFYGTASRRAIGPLTVIGGFASTISWPLSSVLIVHLGWRETCIFWALLHLAIGLPINRLLLPGAGPTAAVGGDTAAVSPARSAFPPMAILVVHLTLTAFVVAGTAAHLPRLLQLTGATSTTAIALSALLGPSQVVARLAEAGLLRRMDSLAIAGVALLLHPFGALLLALAGAPAIAAFVALHGAANGLLTITRGTIPLELWGAAGYGRRLGLLSLPSKVAQAIAPAAFGALIDVAGTMALGVSSALCLTALVMLMILRSTAGRLIARPGAALLRFRPRRADAAVRQGGVTRGCGIRQLNRETPPNHIGGAAAGLRATLPLRTDHPI